MLEKAGLEQLIEKHVSLKWLTKVMPAVRFLVAIVLALYIGSFPPEPAVHSATGGDADGDDHLERRYNEDPVRGCNSFGFNRFAYSTEL